MASKLALIAADFTTQMATALIVGGTTATLQSATDDDGIALPSGRYFFTLDGANSSKEHISCSLAGTALTNIKSLSRQGVETAGVARAHRVGCTVTLTDFAHIKFINDLLAGTTSLDSATPLGYDGVASIISGNQLATKAYVDNLIGGGTVTTNALIETGTAGDTFSAGAVVYLKAADGRWWKASAATVATIQNIQLGIAQSAGSAGANISSGVLRRGKDTNQSGGSAGALGYISDTGTVATSAGTNECVIGNFISPTVFDFNPSFYYVPTASQKVFISNMAGVIAMFGSATPPTGWLLCDGSAVSRTTYAALFAAISTNYGTGDGSTTFNMPDLRSAFPLGYGTRTELFTFVDANVNVGTDVITLSTNKWLKTGQAVALSNLGGALPGGLSATTYYIIRVTDTTYKLATTLANALAGTAVDITSAAGGGTNTFTLTLTNRAIAAKGGEEDHSLSPAEIPSHTHNVSNLRLSTGSNSSNATASVAGGPGDRVSDANTGGDGSHNNMPPYLVVNFIIKT